MDGLVFKEDTHQYFLDGIEVVSLSDVLKDAGVSDYSRVPADVLAHARDRGDAAHYACRLHDALCLDWSTVHPEVKPYVDAYIKFLNAWNPCWFIVEEPLASRMYRFATTPDRVGLVGGVFCDVELKCTDKIMPAVGPQTAAHAICFNEVYGKSAEKIEKRFVLQLKGDGDYKFDECVEKADKTVFLNALNLYNWKKSKRII